MYNYVLKLRIEALREQFRWAGHWPAPTIVVAAGRGVPGVA